MARQFRTKDGHTVRLGDEVWAQNGLGPYVIADTDHGGLGNVYLESVEDPDDGMLFAPEDFPLYVCAWQPR